MSSIHKIFFCLFILCMSIVASCSSDNSNEIVFVDTYALRITSGELKAYSFEDGVKGLLLDSKSLDADIVELNISGQKAPVLIELTGAVFKNPATDEQQSFLPNDSWSTVIIPSENLSSRTNPIQVNPITSLGTALATFKLHYSTDKKQTIHQVKELFRDHFDVDIDTSLSSSGEDIESSLNPDSIKYYLVIAGLCQLVQEIKDMNTDNVSAASFTINDLVRLLTDDLIYDGVLDGIAKNGLITLGNYSFSQKTLKDDLVSAIRNHMKMKGISETREIYIFLQKIRNSSSELFTLINGPDFIPPIISLFSPAENTYLVGTNIIYILARDSSGVEDIKVYINSLNGNEIQDKEKDAATFTGDIDTTLYPDGQLSIIAVATDKNGNSSVKSFTLQIDNKLPTITSNLDVAEQPIVLEDTFPVEINADDSTGSGISEINLIVKGSESESGQIVASIANPEGNNFVMPFDTTTSLTPDGNHTLEIRVTDVAGNTTSKHYAVFINNTIFSNDSFIERSDSHYETHINSTICAGDLNNDGFPDLVNSIMREETERFELSLGNPDTNYNNFAYSYQIDGQTDLRFSLAGKCHINDDAYTDLVIGAPYAYDPGKVYVFFGPYDHDNIWSGMSVLSGVQPSSHDNFGSHIGCVDINGDNYDDLIVRNYTTFEIYFGPNLARCSHELHIPIANITRLGDINNDGAEDFAVGRKIVYGNRYTYDFNITEPFAELSSIAPLGDINNDGFDDIVIGNANEPSNGFGAAHIYLGSSSGPIHYLSLLPPVESSNFGQSITSGDVNGDLYTDIVVGASDNTVAAENGSPLTESGAIFVFLGPDFNRSKTIKQDPDLANNYDRFGEKIDATCDLNLDGRNDLVVQEPRQYSPSRRGGFHVIYDTF